MSQFGKQQSNENVRIHKADFKLKHRIGIPLKRIFTQDSIAKAQRVFDENQDRMLMHCMNYINEMQNTSRSMIDGKRPITDDAMMHISILALNIKSAAGMAGYPMATNMSELLFKFIRQIKEFDQESVAITLTITEAIKAIFKENRQAFNDQLSLEVMRELQQSIIAYMRAHPENILDASQKR